MNTFPTEFTSRPLDVVPDDLLQAGQIALQTLADNQYRVQVGMTVSDAEQLAVICQQDSIRNYCPGDYAERFATVDMSRHWITKGRLVFLLKTASDEVAGYGWTGPSTSSHIPDATLTGGIRVSELHQGRGLATPFLTVILDYTKKAHPNDVLWFGTWGSNTGAVHTYEKLGFVTVVSEPAPRQTNTGETVDDARLFMRRD